MVESTFSREFRVDVSQVDTFLRATSPMRQGYDHVIVRVLDIHPKVVPLTRSVEFVLGLSLGGGPNSNSNRPYNNMCSLSCKNACRFFIHDKYK